MSPVLRDTLPAAVHEDHLRFGFRSGNCSRCYPVPQSWWQRANANTLPTLVVGGVPIEQTPSATSVAVPAVPPTSRWAPAPFSGSPRPG